MSTAGRGVDATLILTWMSCRRRVAAVDAFGEVDGDLVTTSEQLAGAVGSGCRLRSGLRWRAPEGVAGAEPDWMTRRGGGLMVKALTFLVKSSIWIVLICAASSALNVRDFGVPGRE